MVQQALFRPLQSTVARRVIIQIRKEIEERLARELRPLQLIITDESAKHAGHAGARPEGESHFHLRIESDRFVGQPRIERHRLVMAALADLLADRVHALSIEARAPGEAD